ncbi:hypothetical protein ACFWA6_14005 [Streptomyces sp. NPDC060020]|uniref:hypothetical protein n=1 Tax=Streptomyces sp. NPDC060020 TaxID=3347038 RepID=UPI0036B1D3D6
MTESRGPIDAARQQNAERAKCTCRFDPRAEKNHRPWCNVFNSPPGTEQPVRHTADTITDNDLDALYAEREQLLAELDGRTEEARERWIQKQLDETGLKSMDFRNGATMDLEPARDMVAQWVGAARAMLGDAPNYSETPIEMVVKVAEDPERFAFILQRVGKLTPHEARQQAEQRAEQAEAVVARVRAFVGRLDYMADNTISVDDRSLYRALATDLRTALDEPKES